MDRATAAQVLARLRRRLRLDAVPRRARPALAGAAVVVVAFAVGAFVLAPYLIEHAVRARVERVPGRSVRLARVAVNPFSLSVELVEPVLDAPGAGTAFAARSVRVNFDYRTLFGHRVVLDELAVRSPRLRLDLSPAPGGAAGAGPRIAAALGALAGLETRSVRVADGELRLEHAAAGGEAVVFDGVTLMAADLGAGSSPPGRFSATAGTVAIGGSAGASLRLDGTLSLRPLASSGQAELAGLVLDALRPWLGPRLAAMSPAGRLGFKVAYRYAPASAGGRPFGVTGGDATFEDLHLRPAPGVLVRAARAHVRVRSAELAFAAGAWDGAARLDLDGDGVSVEEPAAAGAGAGLLAAGHVAATGVDIESGRTRDAAPQLSVDAVRLVGPSMRLLFGGAPSLGAEPGAVRASSLGEWLAAPVLGAETPSPAQPFVLRRVELMDGRFDVLDEGPGAPPTLHASDVAGTLSAAGLEVTGALGAGATGSLSLHLPVARLERTSVELRLEHVPAATLAPYAARTLGRPLSAGDADLELDYVRDGSSLAGTLRVRGRNLAFAAPVPATAAAAPATAPDAPATAADAPATAADASATAPAGPATVADAAGLPLDLILALLEDPRGDAQLAAPLAAGAEAEPTASVPAAVGRALRQRLAAIAAAPFDALGGLVGRDAADLREVQFAPGTAAPSAAGRETLNALADALRQRPAIVLQVGGAFDAKIDRAVLARQEIELHVALATAGATLNAEPGPLDFSSPRVQDVLDEFAGQRLKAERRATIASEFETGANGKVVARQRPSYYKALFDALVASTTVEHEALARLGRFRAQSVASALGKLGVAEDRIETGAPAPAAGATSEGVPVPLEVRAAASPVPQKQ